MRRVRLLLLPLLLIPSGCLLLNPKAMDVYSPCHATASGNWRAHVSRISITTQKAPLHHTYLFVQGEVTAPEGDQVSLERGPVLQLAGPVQQIMVRTDGPGTGALATHPVQGRFKPLKRYGSISLRCGDGIIGTIKDVPRVEGQ